MEYLSLQAQLQQEITPDDALAGAIFGTTGIDAISDLLSSYCQQQFDVRILHCTFAYCQMSVMMNVKLPAVKTIPA